MLMLAPFLWREGRAVLAAPRPACRSSRVLLSVADSLMFFFAVTYLPLADTVTFYLAAPIYVTALSALFLKEHVGWRRWSAVLVGFIGVIIALRPSAAMLTLPALIGIAGSVVFAVFIIVTRMLRGTSDVVMVERAVRRHAAGQRRGRAVRWIAPSALDFGLMMLLGLVAMVAVRLREPLAQARARKRRGAVSVHDDRVGGGARLAGVRRRAGRVHADRRRDHHRGGPLYPLARADRGAARADLRGAAVISSSRARRQARAMSLCDRAW